MGKERRRNPNWNFLYPDLSPPIVSVSVLVSVSVSVLVPFVIRTCGCFVYFRWLPPASDAAAAFCCCLLFYCNCFEEGTVLLCYVMLWLWCVIRFASHSVTQSVGRTLVPSRLNSWWITIAPLMAVAKANNTIPHLHMYYLWIYIRIWELYSSIPIYVLVSVSVSVSISWALRACLSKLGNYAAHSKQIWKRRESRNMRTKINKIVGMVFGFYS